MATPPSPVPETIRYPSIKNPSPTPHNAGDANLRYPDPLESLTNELSRADVTPSEASEDVLVKIPDAIAHLIDRQASIHLATGDFSIVRLTQGGNGIAVFVNVGNELRWPLTKDQASVKLDQHHYFFSLKVPSEIEEECRASPEEVNEPPSSSSTENLLNYGVTFSATTDAEALRNVDEVLKQYSYFTAPTVVQGDERNVASGIFLDDEEAEKGGLEADTKVLQTLTPKEVPTEEGLTEYWTLMAPNVEDYSSSAAKAIVIGAGHIIRGIFWCSEATIAQLEKGNLYMKGKLKAADSPTKISPSTMRRMRRVRRVSAMSEQIAVGVLTGVIKAAAFITRPLVTSKAGQKLLNLLPGQIALASLEGFGKIFDALEEAGKSVLTTTSVATTGLVAQRYGEEAAELAKEGFSTAGGFLMTAWSVSKLRKVFYPSTLMKSAAKVAGDERKVKNSTEGQLKEGLGTESLKNSDKDMGSRAE